MVKKIFILLLILFLTACGQSKFEKSMRIGKDNLQKQNYNEAVKSFDTALIEKPTDKDAILLMERSKVGLSKQKSKLVLSKYQDENGPNFADFTKIYLSRTVEGGNKGSVFERLADESSLKKIKNKAVDLGRQYNKYPEITKIHDDFIGAIDRVMDALTEEGNNKESSNYVIEQYFRMTSDYLQNYKDKISALKE